MRFARIVVLFTFGFVCVAVNVWLAETGHYIAPLLVFLGFIAITSYILKKLTPAAKE